MKSFSFPLLVLLLGFACTNTVEEPPPAAEEPTTETIAPVEIDTTPRVTGIGGIFFTSNDPEATKAWYGEQLGLAIDPYGSPFEFRNANRPEEINYLRWSLHQEGDELFAPSEKDFMINYRVYNMEGLVANLRSNGVTILDEIVAYEYGKFVHILDPEGNKIELWEPVDSLLTALGGATTK